MQPVASTNPENEPIYKPEMFGSSIVCVGAFNPAIISLDWLERNKLIGSQDADAARLSATLLISRQVAQFETPWFALQVVENQFSLTSKGALTDAFKDLAVGVLTLLPQTPISGIGLNFMGHYKLSLDDFHKLGDVLAPKEIWRELFSSDDRDVGLMDLTVQIQQVNRQTGVIKSKNAVRVTLQPSTVVRNGAYLGYNDHRDLSESEDLILSPAERAAKLTETDWQQTHKDAVMVFDGAISKALAK